MEQLTAAGSALEEVRNRTLEGQAAFARQLGMSRSTYRRRITGQAEFTGSEIVLVQARYDLDLTKLLPA